MKLKKIILVFSLWSLVFSLVGCDAFVRKFTRKPKKDISDREEMVLAPEEYKNPLTKEQQYRQYFLFWRSWQDEVIESFCNVSTTPVRNNKKQIDCINEAIKNLNNMKALLKPDRQKGIDDYVGKMAELRDSAADDSSGTRYTWHRLTAERLKRNIIRDYSYGKIAKDLI